MSVIFSQTKTKFLSSSLSIAFENVDTAKKKLPVHILDGLTLSYKVAVLLVRHCFLLMRTHLIEHFMS